MIKRNHSSTPPVVLFLLLRLVSLFYFSIPAVDSFTVGNPGRSSIRHDQLCISKSCLKYSLYDEDDDDDDDDEDDDDFIDTESLGDWRTFRRNLAFEEDDEQQQQQQQQLEKTEEKVVTEKRPKSVSKENEQILLSQNEELAREYITGVWAHEIATVSIIKILYSGSLFLILNVFIFFVYSFCNKKK